MRKDRFYVPANYNRSLLEWVDEGLSRQLKKVLRLGVSDEVYLFNGSGEEAHVCLTEINGPELKFKILNVQSAKENIAKVTLYAALLKKDNFELVIQKVTEAGVATIVPILTERTVKQGDRLERWRLIAKEAAEQSGRLKLPTIFDPQDFSLALALARKECSTNLIFDLSGEKLSSKFSGSIGLFIGPEGGFSDKELKLAEAQGCRKVSLGDFTLRAETAAIVATFVSAGGWAQA